MFMFRNFNVRPERPSVYSGGEAPLKLNKNIQAPKGRKGNLFFVVNTTINYWKGKCPVYV